MRNDFQTFYGTIAWKECREAYKKRAQGLCERCLKAGIYTPGEIVHHKIELTAENVADPSISLNFDNLELLCREHHAAAHKAAPRRYVFDEMGRILPMGE